MAGDVIEAHLARCPDCAHFAEVSAREHRRLRVRSAGRVPDLTAGIIGRLSAIPPPAPTFRPAREVAGSSQTSSPAAEVQVQMPLSYLDRASSAGSQSGAAKGQDYGVVHSGYTLVYASDGRANLTVDDSARPDQFATTLTHVLSHGFRRSA